MSSSVNSIRASELKEYQKKALWKQLEGYKYLVGQREQDLAALAKQKALVSDENSKILTFLELISKSLPTESSNSSMIEALIPVQNSIQEIFSHDPKISTLLNVLIGRISALSESKTERVLCKISNAPEILNQQARIDQLESTASAQAEKIAQLESEIFVLHRNMAGKSLESDNSETVTTPSKRAKVSDQNEKVVEQNLTEEEQNHKVQLKVANAELDTLKRIAEERKVELEEIFNENLRLKEDLNRCRDQLNRIPQEFWSELPNLRMLQDEIRRYRRDLDGSGSAIRQLEREASDSKYRMGKFIQKLESDVKSKYIGLEDYVKNTDIEITRLRKDRDHMRQMYEQTNNLLASTQKNCLNFQTSLTHGEKTIKNLSEVVGKLEKRLEQFTSFSEGKADLEALVAKLREDEKSYVDELENLGNAFEELQKQNSLLLKKIAEKDDANSKLLGEKLKAEFSLTQVLKENETSSVRLQKLEAIAKERVMEMEAREQIAKQTLLSVDKEMSERIAAADSYKIRLSEASSEIASLRNRLDLLTNELEQAKSKVSGSTTKDQTSFEKKRLLEELSVARKKLDAYASSGVGVVKELEEEVEIYKKLMKCNSCHTRDKNAVILKCMHCFCKTCLDIRIETRQRKCPNCGDPFAATDVKQIYL